MYCVIEMYGDYEPWWFLDGWEEDVIAKKQFDDYYEALKYYKNRWLQMAAQSPLYKSRRDLLKFFWDPEDQSWCEEGDENVQQYHSLFLLENECKIPKSKYRPGYTKQNGLEKHRACSVKLKSAKPL